MALAKTIMLIDDDPDDYEIFSMALVEASPAATCIYFDSAEKAFDALDAACTLLPHYIFLDLNMPRMNGMQFLEIIKQHTTFSQIPVIMYSTSVLPFTREKALQSGAIDFFAKPNYHLELVAALKKLLLADAAEKMNRAIV